MSTTIPDYIINILSGAPKLTPSNFNEWKQNIEMFFSAIDANWITAMDQEVIPAGKEALDKQLCFIIYGTISRELQPLLYGVRSGMEAWRKVCSHFQLPQPEKKQPEKYRPTFAARVQAREAFIHTKHDISKPFSVYLHAVKDAAQEIKKYDATIGDRDVVYVLLANLHPSFYSAKMSVFALDPEKEPRLKAVEVILMGFARLQEED